MILSTALWRLDSDLGGARTDNKLLAAGNCKKMA